MLSFSFAMLMYKKTLKFSTSLEHFWHFNTCCYSNISYMEIFYWQMTLV